MKHTITEFLNAKHTITEIINEEAHGHWIQNTRTEQINTPRHDQRNTQESIEQRNTQESTEQRNTPQLNTTHTKNKHKNWTKKHNNWQEH